MNQERFTNIVNRFERTKDVNGNILNMHYLLIKKDATIYSHRFNDRKDPSDVRSISKTVLTLVAGIVSQMSKDGHYPHFDAETKVFPILAPLIDLKKQENKDHLNEVKIKHLLTHTIGYDKVLLMRGDIVDRDPFTYLDYLLNEPIVHDPGDYYLYSNAGFYLLSALLQEFLKEDLLAFIDRQLFTPLGIKNYRWEKYGNYLAGATRLWLYPEDLLKIGQLLFNKGLYQGQQLVNSDWIEAMLVKTTLTPGVDTPDASFRRYAYGRGIWLAKKPIFFGHGTDGQTLVMVPEKNAIIVTMAHQVDVTELEKIINTIIEEDL